MNILLNDCTLRDGMYLLEKNPPAAFVTAVMHGLQAAGIDLFENGFLQTETAGESLVYRSASQALRFIDEPQLARHVTAFCDASRYDPQLLEPHDGQAFDHLKLSFARHELPVALEYAAAYAARGYRVLFNPMDAPGYSREERSALLRQVNELQPFAFSIVDTFGTLHLSELSDIFTQVQAELDPAIGVGLHTHNNLQLSCALGQLLIDLARPTGRTLIIDCSLYGMGRGAGNAATEVMAAHINALHGRQVYDLGLLLEIIAAHILPLRTRVSWGYDLPHLICGLLGAHVDNLSCLHRHGVHEPRALLEVLERLPPESRKRYGPGYKKSDFTQLEQLIASGAADAGSGDRQ